jgi:hypothetical protein
MFKLICNFLLSLFITVGCLFIAAIPETILYYIWHTLNPITFIEKLLMLILFWLGGVSFCIGFLILAGIGWFIFMKVIWK